MKVLFFLVPVMLLQAAPLLAVSSMEELFKNLAQVRSLGADFTEQRHLDVLAEPLSMSGELRYVRERGVIFDYKAPREETRAYRSGAPVRAGSPNRRTESGSGAAPLPAFLIDIFEGRMDKLERSFSMVWDQEGDTWRTQMTPTDSLRRHLSSITLAGRGDLITQIDIAFANGDRHEIRITSARLNPAFSAAELRGL